MHHGHGAGTLAERAEQRPTTGHPPEELQRAIVIVVLLLVDGINSVVRPQGVDVTRGPTPR